MLGRANRRTAARVASDQDGEHSNHSILKQRVAARRHSVEIGQSKSPSPLTLAKNPSRHHQVRVVAARGATPISDRNTSLATTLGGSASVPASANASPESSRSGDPTQRDSIFQSSAASSVTSRLLEFFDPSSLTGEILPGGAQNVRGRQMMDEVRGTLRANFHDDLSSPPTAMTSQQHSSNLDLRRATEEAVGWSSKQRAEGGKASAGTGGGKGGGKAKPPSRRCTHHHNYSGSQHRKKHYASRFEGWIVSTRPDINLGDLKKETTLGEGHFGRVLRVTCTTGAVRDALLCDSDDERQATPITTRAKAVSESAALGLAGDKAQHQLFALKIMDRDKLNSAKLERMALRECEMMRVLSSSPFHIQLINTYKTSSRLFMLMELAREGDLASRIGRKPSLTPSLCRHYTSQLVLALKHMHQDSIIHRDVKPSNVLLGCDGRLKLCDFGFARRLVLGQKANTMLGTYAYLAPEQCSFQPYDHSADMWSLGILVYEMMYGTTPFESHHEDDDEFSRRTMQNIRKSTLRFPMKGTVAFSAKLFLKAILTKMPEKRLGYRCNFDELMSHAWFIGVDWDAL